MKRSIRLTGTIGITVVLTCLMFSGTVVNAERLDAFRNRNQYTTDVFSDVSKDSWYYENVKKTYESGLMVGKGGSCFAPLSDITIAEVITIASRLHAICMTGSESFGVSEPWYQTYLDYARENGIPDFPALSLQKKADRAEFVMILAAALPKEALGKKIPSMII